jgi:Phage integrase, N-terminal SAM-like domain.
LLWLKAKEITHPLRENILEFKQYLQEKELKETTISAYLKAIKRLFEYLAKTGQYENIAYGIKQPLINRIQKTIIKRKRSSNPFIFHRQIKYYRQKGFCRY